MGRRLDVLGAQMPEDLRKRQQNQRRTQDILLQESVKQQGLRPGSASRTGAQVAGNKERGALEERAKQAPQVTQVAQASLQQKGIESRRKIAEVQRGLQQDARRNSQRLFNLDQSIKNELLDNQLTFRTDELGRQQFNERQLADYAIANANNQNDLAAYSQTVQQITQRKLQLLGAAEQRIKQELEQLYQKESTEANQQLKRELAEAQHAMQQRIQREQAKAANRAGMLGAAGSIVGGGLGALVGGPAGAVAGASIGNGLFTAFGS